MERAVFLGKGGKNLLAMVEKSGVKSTGHLC